MPDPSQAHVGVVIAVSGVAGSGKSTLGRTVATALMLPLVDLDAVTNPLLESLPPAVLGGHWLSSGHGGAIRAGRYAALLAVARDVVRTAGGIVMVAPFTAELRGGVEWHALRAAVEPHPLHVIHLKGDVELFARRRVERGEARDVHRPDGGVPSPPAVPVIAIDARLDPQTQQRLALAAIDAGRHHVSAPSTGS